MLAFSIPFFPEQATGAAREVDAMFGVWLAVSLFFTLLIAALIVVFMVRFRRRHPDEVGRTERPWPALEIIWSAVPFFIMLAMFAWGARVFFEQRRAPADAVEYWAIGKQWMWKFQHPNGNREINHLHVPVGQTVKLTMTSEDVIHSFGVPAFRLKQDVNPGYYTTVWFRPDRPGTYHLFCNQYCGAEHSRMVGSIVVMTPDDYAAWMAGGPAAGQSSVAAGAQLFQSLACYTCHEMGPGWMARGPSLQGVYGHQVALEGGGTVLADEGYLRESILLPAAKVVKGWQPIMPTYQGQVSEEQLIDLIAYLKSIGNAPAMGTGAMVPAGSSSPADGGPAGSMPVATAPAPQAGPGASRGPAGPTRPRK
jgi:cytochrome c oxidase subunit 2